MRDVIDDLIGSECGHHVGIAGAAYARDMGAVAFRQLDDGRAPRANGSVDQDSLSRPDPRPVPQKRQRGDRAVEDRDAGPQTTM